MLLPKEKELVKALLRYQEVLSDAAEKLAPSVMANFAYELARAFNQFYHDHAIIDSEHVQTSLFRLVLCDHTAFIISRSMKLMGIHVPDRM